MIAGICEGGAPDFNALALAGRKGIAAVEGCEPWEGGELPAASAANSFAYGPGYDAAFVDMMAYFEVKAVDGGGNLAYAPSWNVSSTMEGMQFTEELLDCSTSLISYTCEEEGEFVISVTLYGDEIANSPKSVSCLAQIPPSPTPVPSPCPTANATETCDCPADSDSSDGWVWTLVALSVVEAVIIVISALLAAPLIFHMIRDIGFRDIIRDRILMREFNTPMYSAVAM
eukprot:CAMPEP_0114617748 /NCGR_PEP_ID=MMETSP0168-20121206/7354_1 /TAXON_ID=95228 ORGANISM="Vannella sp., Strain DIVA3 517/6/12" /NCGR_SAMPLE_ID=MMETSP0168 /ASSEMBLY_ACC=CAM_ASM_000044 /LENGTH=228 /DNA_ID=CAMNT_0001828887 /DNA_START=99 /DNA_END=782 /DNA_ORIENTATION=-